MNYLDLIKANPEALEGTSKEIRNGKLQEVTLDEDDRQMLRKSLKSHRAFNSTR